MNKSEKVYKWVCKNCGNVNFAISLDDVYCDACQEKRTDEELISLESEGQDATTPPPTYEPPVVPVEPALSSSEENVYVAEERELSSREAAPSGIYAVGDILSAAGAEMEDSEEDTETDVAEEVVDYAPAVAPTPAPASVTPEKGFYCPQCGSPLSYDAKFCTNCGRALGMTATETGGAFVPPPLPTPVAPEATASSEEKEEGNKSYTTIIIGLILVIVGLGGYLLGSGGKKEAMPAVTPTPVERSSTTASTSQSSAPKVPQLPVPEAKAKPTPKPPVQSTPTPSSYDTLTRQQAADFVRSFYQDLDNKAFRRAHNKFSQDLRDSDFANYYNWKNGYKDSISSEVQIHRLKVVDAKTVQVYFTLYARNRRNREIFSGYWEVTKIDGRTYLDDYRIKKL